MKLSQAIDGFYLFFVTSGNSKSTADLYKIYLNRFCKYLNDPVVTTISEKRLMEFYAYMQTGYIPHRPSGDGSPLSQSSIMKIRNALRAFYIWAEDEKLITHKNRPDMRLKTFRVEGAEVLPYTTEEIKALLKAAEYTRKVSPANRREFNMKRRTSKRDTAMLQFLLDTGVRVSEMCRALVKDVNMENGEVFIPKFSTAKKSKGRTVYLGDSAKRALWSYLAERGNPGPSAPLFVSERRATMTRNSVQALLADLGIKAGVPNVHPHRFRHTFAIFYLRNGGDIYTLQAQLGHTTLEMVKVYLQLADTDSKAAHRRASPVDNLK